MSSAGGVLAADVSQMYFCHQCNRTVTITLSPNADLQCPTCNGDFLEEWIPPNPNSDRNRDSDPHSFPDPFTSFLDALPYLLSSSGAPPPGATFDLRNPNNFSNTASTRSLLESEREPDAFDPFAFLEDYLDALSQRGADFRFVYDGDQDAGSGSGFRFRMPSNIGDYFIGPGFEQLIQQLAENDPNRYGTPPASKNAVKSLPNIVVDEELLSSDLAQCAVCKDDFEAGMEVKQMPCKHVYHQDCILPWLELHNSCPVCRYELPTDDPDYENRNTGEDSGNVNRGSDVSQGNLQRGQNRAPRRTLSISLRFPFDGSGAGSSGGGNDDDGSNSTL